AYQQPQDQGGRGRHQTHGQLDRVPGVGGQMSFGKEAAKSPSEQHGSDQASEYNEGGESGIHRELINPLLPEGTTAITAAASVPPRRICLADFIGVNLVCCCSSKSSK